MTARKIGDFKNLEGWTFPWHDEESSLLLDRMGDLLKGFQELLELVLCGLQLLCGPIRQPENYKKNHKKVWKSSNYKE